MVSLLARLRNWLSRQRNSPCASENLRQPSEHYKVSMKGHALQAASAKRGESVVVLEPAKLALDGYPAPVEALESLSVAPAEPGPCWRELPG